MHVFSVIPIIKEMKWGKFFYSGPQSGIDFPSYGGGTYCDINWSRQVAKTKPKAICISTNLQTTLKKNKMTKQSVSSALEKPNT
jgi:hypothetical protein